MSLLWMCYSGQADNKLWRVLLDALATSFTDASGSDIDCSASAAADLVLWSPKLQHTSCFLIRVQHKKPLHLSLFQYPKHLSDILA